MSINSSTANSSSAAQRKKQEEQHDKIIRELLAIPPNKVCFECGQRGPTYANVSNGSFCCMHCSGLLRGLNPPQRVKSISMATFTDEDIEKLQSTGNEENSKIWLGLYDKQVKFEPRVNDDVRQHLIQKYENKRWYVSPDDLAQQKKLLEEHNAQHKTLLSGHQRRDSISSHKSNQSAPANLHPKEKLDPFDLLTGDFPVATTQDQGITTPIASPPSMVGFSNPLSHSTVPPPLRHKVPPPPPQFPPVCNELPPAKNTALFDAFAPTGTSTSTFNVQFADFDEKFNSLKLESTHPIVATDQQRKPLPQSSSMFATPPAAVAPWPSSLESQTAFPNFTTNQPEKKVGMTKDGLPIMSTPTTLPDYSALEELFRGPAVSAQTNSSVSTVFSQFSNPPTTGGNFGAPSVENFAHFDPITVQKSSTMGAFTEITGKSFVNDLVPAQFKTNFSANFSQHQSLQVTPATQHSQFSTNTTPEFSQAAAPDPNACNNSTPAKNWNPFLI